MMERMSEEVPARPGQATDAWTRWVVGWQVAFWLMLGIALFRLTMIRETEDRTVVALVALAVLAGAYLPVRNRPDVLAPRLARSYLLVAAVVVGVACWVHPGLSILLFIVFPQVWVYSEELWEGVAWSAAVAVSATIGFVADAGWSAGAVWDIAPDMLVSLLFSLLLGLWISRIVLQSRERADLIAQLERTRSDLALAHHAQGVTAERERLAREIHDTLAQGFTSVVMLSQVAADALERDPAAARERLETIESVARENLAEARALVAAFSPVGLDGTTLPDAVGRLAERFGGETGLAVDVQTVGDFSGLAREQEVVVLRVAQEALTNVRRHAQARQVTVHLVADERGARVEVGDDGVGFAPARVQGFGLAGMRGRVAEVGGDLDVASAPGRGTRVTVRVPLLPRQPEPEPAAAPAPAPAPAPVTGGAA
jgi:signal transduction histidine kinase